MHSVFPVPPPRLGGCVDICGRSSLRVCFVSPWHVSSVSPLVFRLILAVLFRPSCEVYFVSPQIYSSHLCGCNPSPIGEAYLLCGCAPTPLRGCILSPPPLRTYLDMTCPVAALQMFPICLVGRYNWYTTILSTAQMMFRGSSAKFRRAEEIAAEKNMLRSARFSVRTIHELESMLNWQCAQKCATTHFGQTHVLCTQTTP